MMKKVPKQYLAWPMLLVPFPAMAANMAPAGFEDLPNVYGSGFPQNFIDVNKQCITFVEQAISS